MCKTKHGLSFIFSILLCGVAYSQTLTIMDSPISLAADEASTASIVIASDSYWGLYDVPAWLTPDTAWYKGNKELNFSANRNPYTVSRSAKVKVYWMDANWAYFADTTIEITQPAARFGVSDSLVKIGSQTGNDATFAVKTDNYWKIDNLPFWLSVDKNWITGNATLKISATETNPLCAVRKATFSLDIQNGTKEEKASVTVEQKASSIGISAEKILIDASQNSTIKFWILTSRAWLVSEKCSWLKVSKSQATGTDTIIVTADENPNLFARVDTITVTITGGRIYKLAVMQKPAAAVFDLSSVENVTNTLQFTIQSNTKWGIIKMPSWFNTADIFGFEDSTFTIKVPAATGTEAREGSYTAYWFDEYGNYHQKIIVVTQSKEGIISLEEKSVDMGAVWELIPNPARNQFSVSGADRKIREVTVYSMDGRLMTKVSEQFDAIDISYLQEANYNVVIMAADNTIGTRILSKQ